LDSVSYNKLPSLALFVYLTCRAKDWQRYEDKFEETPFAIGSTEKNHDRFSKYKALKEGKEWNRVGSTET